MILSLGFLCDMQTTPSNKRVFRHRFRGGVRAGVVVNLDKYRAGNPSLKCTWEGKPTQRILGEYKRWTLLIESSIANELGKKLMHTFLLGKERFEIWVFAPGEAPKLVSSCL